MRSTVLVLFFLFFLAGLSAQGYSIVLNGPADNCTGAATSLSITPSGGISFKWYSAVAYPNGPVYGTGPVFIPPTSGYFLCEVTDAIGVSITQTVRLRGLNPYITSSTGNTASCVTSPVVLQDQISYIYQMNFYDTYQWYLNGVPISGANGRTYAAAVSGTYELRIGISCGTAISNPVQVTIYNPIPTVTSITAGGPLSFCSGGSVNLSVPVYAATYQWKKNGVAISGANTASYVASTAGNYTCSISNACNSITTAAVTVNVLPIPTASIVASGPLVFCSGGSVQLSATQGSGYNYLWQKDGQAISGATAATYVAALSGAYQVVVTSAGCSSTSSVVNVTANPVPTPSFTGLAPSYVCQSPPATLSGSPAGGNFSGPGISGSQFQPSLLATGGPYAISYSVTNSYGCSATATQSTNVVSGFNCLAPQALTVISVTSTSVTFRWSYSSSGQFQVRYRKTGTTTYTVKTFSATACQNTYTLTGLRKSVAYEMNLRSYCTASSASAYSNTATFTTPAAREKEAVTIVFPNPASEIIHVSLPHMVQGESARLRIFDLKGVLYKELYEPVQESITLYVADIPAGMYFLRVESDGIAAETVRILIQR